MNIESHPQGSVRAVALRHKVLLVTTGLWVIATGVYAYSYLVDRINSRDAEGYERLWDWQLFFFALHRLPVLVLLLVVVLWGEFKRLPRR